MRFEHDVPDLEAMKTLAQRIARVLRPGDVLGLDGPMGAGKTTFVRMMMESLGVEAGAVSSPTFVVAAEYPYLGGVAIHIDAYRLGSGAELEGTGWDDRRGEEVVVIEWAARVEEVLPAESARVWIEPTGETSRRVRFDLPESWDSREGCGALIRGDTICPVTGVPVSGENPHWPFADERARWADLYRWFSGQHVLSRRVDASGEADVGN
ncbi:MAG: tRNA (adenosine(37)-N6)-threonylcarbamoyltransferase complex ATPase subunit type 1 TsaE [Phycisphaeraceae bacterium]|nr:tRNA (adenosine(37)-N6)-threonylcarbamoyltransferase complex ATPase subunit type 1 TsaE [Phycisphaeraceae bacterium]